MFARFFDSSANATPKFEGRGGEELATQISNMLARAYDNQRSLDLASFCVISCTQVWVLYIDILVSLMPQSHYCLEPLYIIKNGPDRMAKLVERLTPLLGDWVIRTSLVWNLVKSNY